MKREEYRDAAYEMLRLIRDSITKAAPDRQKTNNIDFGCLLEVSRKNGLAAMTAYALKYQGIRRADFDLLYAKAQRCEILFDAEYRSVSEALCQKKIRHIPLKGMVVKSLYPAAGLREMSDMDIFFDAAYAPEVRRILSDRGYRIRHYDSSNHDVYYKAPMFCIEMHRNLVDPDLLPELAGYYEQKMKAFLNASESYRMSFSHEETYLYLIAHAYKHYVQAGFGLRVLLDVYFVMKLWGDDIDTAYIEEECRRMEIAEFESRLRTLTAKIFSLDALTESEKRFLEEILMSGLYGTKEQYYQKAIKKTLKGSPRGGKLAYIKARMKLPQKTLDAHPFISRHKALAVIPAAGRLIKAPFKRRKAVVAELKSLKRYKDEPE